MLPSSGVDQIRAVELRSSHEDCNSTPPNLPAAMLELQSAHSNCHSIDRTLQAIATALGTACEADCCVISAIDRWSGYPTQADFACLLAHPALSVDRQAIEQVELPDAIAVGNLSLRSLLVLRVQRDDRTLGMVILGHTTPTDWQSAIEQWQHFDPIVELAIAQIRLQQQLQQQTSYQTWTQQLSEAIRTTSQIDPIFALAIEATTSALAIDQGAILLLKYSHLKYSQPRLNRRTHHLPIATVTLACAKQERSIPAAFQLADCELCQQAFLEQPEPVLITDNAAFGSPLHLSEFPALLLMPLTHQKTVLGFLALQHRQAIAWSSEAIAWVKLIATQLSTAIIQTRAFQQIHALVDDRTAQLQRSLEVQAKLYEKTRQQVDQLRHMNQLKDEFLSTMSHELRTPLTSMTLAIRMLRQSNLPFDRQQRYLDILEQQCTQETNLINDLLALQKLDSRQTPLQIRKVDLKLLIGDRTTPFETDWTHKNLTLAIDLPDDPLTLYTNLDGLDRILLELLTNAGKYAAPDSTIDLQVRQSDDAVTLQLANLGAAIVPEELPFIFDKFRRGSGITQQAIPGTGLGLALVKSLVSHLKGAIAATSEPQSNGLWRTCLTLTLPKKITREGEA
ncbi:GAF domain-containing sensor histidine kinase [Microcoleus sp. FACHB-1515]|uniref:sensor histidine kinase n=1 Tax=Cyanophyceae TaxID=3028117 RepID=UPI001686B37A|nr:GAF domain-containing sensor histidine kinase [Microcoleus sp. FACHB-1515]MBD2093061.1 GAF domain-containing sensor histidine kinase [Microcoleus sp. FACHB-1515]